MTSHAINQYLYWPTISSYIVLWTENNERWAENSEAKYISRRLSSPYLWQTFHIDWLSIYLEYKCWNYYDTTEVSRQFKLDITPRINCYMWRGSISAAADRLNITQSAVSQNLKKLEEQLENQLVIRNTKPLELTPIGRYCLQVAQTIFTEITSIEAMKGSNLHLLEGNIKLLVVSRLHNPKYNDFLVYFKKKYPNITLDLTVKSSTDILNDLKQKTLLLVFV